jgi:hypothetical protein
MPDDERKRLTTFRPIGSPRSEEVDVAEQPKPRRLTSFVPESTGGILSAIADPFVEFGSSVAEGFTDPRKAPAGLRGFSSGVSNIESAIRGYGRMLQGRQSTQEMLTPPLQTAKGLVDLFFTPVAAPFEVVGDALRRRTQEVASALGATPETAAEWGHSAERALGLPFEVAMNAPGYVRKQVIEPALAAIRINEPRIPEHQSRLLDELAGYLFLPSALKAVHGAVKWQPTTQAGVQRQVASQVFDQLRRQSPTVAQTVEAKLERGEPLTPGEKNTLEATYRRFTQGAEDVSEAVKKPVESVERPINVQQLGREDFAQRFQEMQESQRTVPANPQAHLRIREIEQQFAEASRKGDPFPLGKFLTEELMGVIGDDAGSMQRLESLAESVRAHNSTVMKPPVIEKPAGEKARPEATSSEQAGIPGPVEQQYRATIEQAGARYDGVQKDKAGNPRGVWFTDPRTGSTLMLDIAELTPERIRQHMEQSRAGFRGEPPETLPEKAGQQELHDVFPETLAKGTGPDYNRRAINRLLDAGVDDAKIREALNIEQPLIDAVRAERESGFETRKPTSTQAGATTKPTAGRPEQRPPVRTFDTPTQAQRHRHSLDQPNDYVVRKTPSGKYGVYETEKLISEPPKLPAQRETKTPTLEEQQKGTMFEKEKPEEPGMFDPTEPKAGKESNVTWNEAIKESLRRLKEKGLSPDKPSGSLATGLDPTIIVDPAKVKYVLDPIMQKARVDVARLVQDGAIRAEEFGRQVKRLLRDNKAFGSLPARERQFLLREAMKQADDLVYNPLTATAQTRAEAQFRQKVQNLPDVLDPRPVEGGRIISEYRKEEFVDPLQVHTDGLKSFTEGNLRTFGEYVNRQGESGKALVNTINRDYRQSAQWAGQLEQRWSRVSKQLNDAEWSEFVRLSDEGGTTANPKVQQALTGWKEIAHEIADRAVRAELETSVYDAAKQDFVKVPFRERDNFFPHTWDWTDLKKAEFREGFIQSFAEKQRIPKTEAELLFNKWLRRNIEVKYGHLEHARNFDAPGWKTTRDVIPSYIERATRRIVQSEQYGKDYAVAQNYIEQIRQQGGDYKAAQVLFDRVVGRDNYDRTWAQIQSKINSWQVATKLTLLSTLNWTQLNNAGLIAGWKGLARTLWRQFANYAEMRDFAERTGAILQSTLRMHQKESLSLEGVGGKVLKLTGVGAQERWLRTLSSNWIADAMNRDMRQLVKNPEKTRLRAELQRKLDYLGLGRDISVDRAVKEGGFSEKQLLDIGYEGTRKTQFLSRPQDVQRILSNPDLKMFTLFKSFISQQTKLLYDAVIKEGRHGNLKPLAYLVTMFPAAGELAQNIRSLITGRDRPDNLLERIVEDVATVGALGIIFDMLQAAGRSPDGLAMWMAGPTVTTASDLAYGVTQAAKGKLNPLLRFGAKQIPVPILQQRLNNAVRADKTKTVGIMGR